MQVEIDPHSGFCGGVIRAIGTAEEILAKGGKLYSLGAIVHNEEELRRLQGRGLVTIDTEDLREMRDPVPEETLLIRAHGEPPRWCWNCRKRSGKPAVAWRRWRARS